MRYAADPKTLWGWFEPYIKDDEVIVGFGYILLLKSGFYDLNLFLEEPLTVSNCHFLNTYLSMYASLKSPYAKKNGFDTEYGYPTRLFAE